MLSRGPAKDGATPTVFITVDDDVFADWILYKITAENVSYVGIFEINKYIVAPLICFSSLSVILFYSRDIF